MPSKPGVKSLTVLTINTWHGHILRGLARAPVEPAGRSMQRKAMLQEGIAELSPDVILLQECLPEPRYSASIAEALGYDVLHQPTNSGVRIGGSFGLPLGGREGIAILARTSLQLRKLATKRLCGFGCNTTLFAFQATGLNYALAGEVVVDGQPVAFVCTHFLYALPDVSTLRRCWRELGERGMVDTPIPDSVLGRTRRTIRRRDRGIARLSQFIARLADGRPVVVAGDFNLEATAPSMQLLARDNRLVNALDESLSTPTWDPVGNSNVAFSTTPPRSDEPRPSAYASAIRAYDAIPQRPDHILVDERWMTVASARIVLKPETSDDICPSDHYGILADLRLSRSRMT